MGAALLCTCSIFQFDTRNSLILPITPHNLVAAVLGMLLGPVSGAGSVGLFCIAGAAAGFFGVRIFPSELAGIDALRTIAGGAVTGYFFAAAAAGFCTRKVTPTDERAKAFPAIVHGSIGGILCSSIPLILSFRSLAGSNLVQAVQIAFIPLLPAEVIKMILTAIIADVLRRPVGLWLEERPS